MLQGWSFFRPFWCEAPPPTLLVHHPYRLQLMPMERCIIAGTTLGPASFGVPPPIPLTPTLSTTSGAFQTTSRNDSSAFVMKLHPDGSDFDYATYLGGSTSETLGGIAVDSSGVAYLDGGTASADFPTTSGAFQQTNSGKSAFLSKLTADGSSLLYSTFLGAAGLTAKATGIAVDGSKAAYLTGETSGPGFPTTPGAFKTTVPSATPVIQLRFSLQLHFQV